MTTTLFNILKAQKIKYRLDGQTLLVTWISNGIAAVQEYALKQNADRDEPPDEITEKALRIHIKSLRKGAEQLGDCELATAYLAEAVIVELYLPIHEEVVTPGVAEAVQAAVDELGATGNPKMVGQVTGYVMKQGKGFPGKEVANMARKLCSL